jgi:predicted nucleic acid-binding Zn ribbon protein
MIRVSHWSSIGSLNNDYSQIPHWQCKICNSLITEDSNICFTCGNNKNKSNYKNIKFFDYGKMQPEIFEIYKDINDQHFIDDVACYYYPDCKKDYDPKSNIWKLHNWLLENGMEETDEFVLIG